MGGRDEFEAGRRGFGCQIGRSGTQRRVTHGSRRHAADGDGDRRDRGQRQHRIRRQRGHRRCDSHGSGQLELENTGKRNRYGPYEVTVDSFSGFVDRGAASDRPVDGFERVLRSPSKARERRQARKKAARAKAKVRRARRRGPSAKVSVQEAGLYRLDAATIAATLGVSESRVRRLIRNQGFVLRNRGRQVATLSPLDEAAWYFYGEAIESQYTQDNVYVLRTGKGQPMGSVDGGAVVPVPEQSFPYTSQAEGNRFTLTHLFDDPDGDYWMWDFRIGGMTFGDCETVTAPQPCYITQFPIPTPGLDRGAGGDAELVVRLHGASNPEGTGDHRVTISLNGNALDMVVFDGLSPFEARFKVPINQLLDGENTVQVDVQAPPQSGGLAADHHRRPEGDGRGAGRFPPQPGTSNHGGGRGGHLRRVQLRHSQRRFARDRADRYLLDIYNLIGDPATVVK